MRRLLIRPGAIGDCILSLPALEFLRSDYTEVWTPAAVVPLIRFADCVRAISSTGLDLVELPGTDGSSAFESLRSFDSIISWYGANREEFRDCVRKLGLPFEFFKALPEESLGIHVADFFLSQVCGTPPAIPRISVPAGERQDFAIIHPFSGSVAKNWPLHRFREFAERLSMPVRWCSGPEDPSLPGAIHMDDLYELAGWLSSARVYIGNDSGLTHLAAAVGTPVVAIFGPTDPAVWAPRAVNRQIVRGDLQELDVNAVLAAVDALLR